LRVSLQQAALLTSRSPPRHTALNEGAFAVSQMGMDGVFVGSGIFKSGDAAKRARAIVQARIASPPPLHPAPSQRLLRRRPPKSPHSLAPKSARLTALSLRPDCAA